MMQGWWRGLVVLAGATWGLSASVLAMVVVPSSLPEVVAESSLIVHGRVVEVRGVSRGDRRDIESLVTLVVLDSLKGTPGTTVVLRVPGGQVGRYRRVMVGVPAFAEGDEVVVFLAGHGPAVPVPVGVGQGVYRVVQDGEGESVVTPPALETAPPGVARVVRGDPARRPVALAEFTRRVRTIVEARGSVGR